MTKLKYVIFIILLCPVLILMVIHRGELVNTWGKIPGNIRMNFSSLISQDKTDKVDVERWNAFGPAREDLPSRLFYNKGLVLVDDAFSFLTYFSPRFYFQAGDGTNFSPSNTEPLAVPLFFFWVIGVISLIKTSRFRPLLAVLIFGIIAFFAGQRNFAFLFPVLALYLYISFLGIESVKNVRTRNIIYIAFAVYGLFLLGRMFLLK